MCSLTLSPALLSSTWMIVCLLPRLPAWWLNYSFLDGCEEFETFTWTILHNCMFFCICTDLLYRYYFPDSDIYCVYYPNATTYYHLTPDSCMLSPDTCLISLITYHLHNCLTCLTYDYHIYRNSVLICCIIYSDLNL